MTARSGSGEYLPRLATIVSLTVVGSGLGYVVSGLENGLTMEGALFSALVVGAFATPAAALLAWAFRSGVSATALGALSGAYMFWLQGQMAEDAQAALGLSLYVSFAPALGGAAVGARGVFEALRRRQEKHP